MQNGRDGIPIPALLFCIINAYFYLFKHTLLTNHKISFSIFRFAIDKIDFLEYNINILNTYELYDKY